MIGARRLALAIPVLAFAVIGGGMADRADGADADAGNAAAPAAPPPGAETIGSLMFNPQEVQAVEKAYADHLHPAALAAAQAKAEAARQAQIEAEKPRVPNIYVSAILDLGGGQWTVWANGIRITPDHQPPLFHVVAVNGNTVEIVSEAEASTHIRLQPNQTWISRDGSVVEGIVP